MSDNRNTSLEAPHIIQTKADSGLDQGLGGRAGQKWLDPRHILKEELVGFEGQLIVGHEKSEG